MSLQAGRTCIENRPQNPRYSRKSPSRTEFREFCGFRGRFSRVRREDAGSGHLPRCFRIGDNSDAIRPEVRAVSRMPPARRPGTFRQFSCNQDRAWLDRGGRHSHFLSHLERPVPRGEQFSRPPTPRCQDLQPGRVVDAEARLVCRGAAVAPDPSLGRVDGLVASAGVDDLESPGLLCLAMVARPWPPGRPTGLRSVRPFRT